ncbi:MAG: hypothetical protein WBA28_04315, partial [Microbacteriaceae bacterium]
TVLGVRTFPLAEIAELDIVVKQRAILDRIARLDAEGEHPRTELAIPAEAVMVSWGGVTPPRAGWRRVLDIQPAALKQIAEEGIAEIAEVIPGELGEARVRKVRGEVWGRNVADRLGLSEDMALCAGIGFAALSLGFLDKTERLTVFENGPWLRVSSPYGDVLARKHG